MTNLNISFSFSCRETGMRPLKDLELSSILDEKGLRELSELVHNAEALYFMYLDELERRRSNGDVRSVNVLSEFVSKFEELVNGIPTPQILILKASGTE
jgi:hypothetical protein